MERPFDVEYSPTDRVLTVHGSVDAECAASFRDALEAATRGHTQDLVVDLSDADFFPALAVGVLVGTISTCPAEVTVVARPGSVARRVLGICGLPCGPTA